MFMAETFRCKQPVAPGLQIRCLSVCGQSHCFVLVVLEFLSLWAQNIKSRWVTCTLWNRRIPSLKHRCAAFPGGVVSSSSTVSSRAAVPHPCQLVASVCEEEELCYMSELDTVVLYCLSKHQIPLKVQCTELPVRFWHLHFCLGILLLALLSI